MSVGRLCPGCGRFIDRGVRHRCERMPRTHRKRIYDDPRWRETRLLVFARDGRRCRECRRLERDLDTGEQLVCDHWPVPVLECVDPFDPASCRTVCSTCSGRVDGARSGF